MTESTPVHPAGRRGWPRRLLRLAAWCVALAVLGWFVSSGVFVWWMTHGHFRSREIPPEQAGLPVEALRLPTRDGETLGAWLLRGRRADAPAVIILHGIGGSRRDGLPIMRRLHAEGYTVVSLTLRGHGDSTGQRIDFGYGSRADVVAAVDLVARETPQARGVVVCGSSLGSAAALFAAKELDHRVRGYVLESPYQNLDVATRNRLEMRLPRYVDDVAYAGIWLWSRILLPYDPRVISPERAARDVPHDVPVTILYGKRDRHATPAEAEAIYAAVKSHGRIVRFPRGRHANLFKTDPDTYYGVLRELLERTVPAPTTAPKPATVPATSTASARVRRAPL